MEKRQYEDILFFKKNRVVLQRLAIIGALSTITLLAYFLWIDLFNRPELIQSPLEKLGFFGPAAFFFLSILNTIYPVIPAGMGSVIGYSIFGPTKGFLLAFTANIIGSLILFYLAKRYGKPILYAFCDTKLVDKSLSYLKKFNIEFILAVVYIVPGLPDDVFTLLAGVTDLSPKRMTLLQLIFKPLTMYLYMMGVTNVFTVVSGLFA